MNHLQVMIKLDIQERRWRKHEKLSYLYVFVDNPWKDTGYPGANSLDDPNLGIAALARSFDHYWPSLLLQISKELWGAVEQPKYDLLWHIHILLHGGFLPWGERSNLSWPTNMRWNCSPRGFIEESGPFVRRQYVSQEWGPCSASRSIFTGASFACLDGSSIFRSPPFVVKVWDKWKKARLPRIRTQLSPVR